MYKAQGARYKSCSRYEVSCALHLVPCTFKEKSFSCLPDGLDPKNGN